MGRIEYEYPLFKVYYSNNSNNLNIRGNPGLHSPKLNRDIPAFVWALLMSIIHNSCIVQIWGRSHKKASN